MKIKVDDNIDEIIKIQKKERLYNRICEKSCD